jgi:predicted Zn-dependent protease
MAPSPTAPIAPVIAAQLQDILVALVRRGWPDAEALMKRGRSRRVELTTCTETSAFTQEQAWAVRAGHHRGSLFAAGTGEPHPDGPWPEPSGRAVRIPEPVPVPVWNEPSDFDTPLIGEREGLKLLESLGKELTAELPKARLLHAALEDGSSESDLANSRGLRARTRSRVATLYLEAAGPGRPDGHQTPTATLYLSAREARKFHPPALARRLADRLAVLAQGGPPEHDTGDMLLAPPVASHLLCGLLPLLVGPKAATAMSGLRDHRGRIGSPHLTLIDNGRLAGGAFESSVDGEGMPTREVLLIDQGFFRQPLLTWWQSETASGAPSGCMRRAGWRDLPVPGPTHLYLKPDPKIPVAGLLGAVTQGYYLIDVTGGPHFDLTENRFALPVCGFAVQSGRATAPVAGAWLCGKISQLLQNIAGIGRDLAFHPLNGMIGSPTLLVTGLELRKG